MASIDLEPARTFLATDTGLCVVSLTRPDGSVSSSVVNAGFLPHPISGDAVLGFVVQASAYKRRRLLVVPTATVCVQRAWKWQAVEGRAELIGPLDPHPSGPLDLPALLRDVFRAAGGTHADWDEFDRVMADQQRTAVLLHPTRTYGVPGT
ncbi:MAG: pyridoxamine 5'-phosphate oxidase [Acidimicrobiales bacterium]